MRDEGERFGLGILGDEEQVLKVEALQALGRRAEATQLGQRYLSQRPNGTQAATMRRLLESDQKSETRP